METLFLTVGKIRRAAKKHRYIVLEDNTGWEMAVNTGIAAIIQRLRPRPDNHVTWFVKWRPCTFHEYISKKHPFQ